MLVLTLVIMGVATFLIGLLPTYAQIGPWAAVLLVAAADRAGLRRRRRMGRRRADGGRARAAGQARLLRQLAADRRAGRTAAVDRGVLAISRGCRKRQFLAWGWRVPFLLSILLVGVGLVIRLAHPRDAGVREDEGDAARSAAADHRSADARTRSEVLLAMGARFAENGAFYIYSVFVLDLRDAAGGAWTAAAWCSTAILLASPRSSWSAIPLYGALSDRVGRRPVYLFGAVSTARPRLPAVLAARHRIDAAGLAGDDRAVVPVLARGDVRAAGGVPVGAVRHPRPLQRRVAGRAAVVGAGRRAVPAHRHGAAAATATAAARCRCI